MTGWNPSAIVARGLSFGYTCRGFRAAKAGSDQRAGQREETAVKFLWGLIVGLILGALATIGALTLRTGQFPGGAGAPVATTPASPTPAASGDTTTAPAPTAPAPAETGTPEKTQ